MDYVLYRADNQMIIDNLIVFIFLVRNQFLIILPLQPQIMIIIIHLYLITYDNIQLSEVII
jgi:hypothetical protein